jgi:hypothetical protein
VPQPVRMQRLCRTAGGQFIKAHASAIGAVCLQTEDVHGLAASELAAADLEIPYAAVLAAAPCAACMPQFRPCCYAALWIMKGLVPDAPELALRVCHPDEWENQVGSAAQHLLASTELAATTLMCITKLVCG